jgi:hypothetical protein
MQNQTTYHHVIKLKSILLIRTQLMTVELLPLEPESITLQDLAKEILQEFSLEA